jgi:hemoglobin
MTQESRLRRPMDRRNALRTGGGLAVFFCAFALVGCGDDDDNPMPTATSAAGGATAMATGTGQAMTSLYTRLGERPAIEAVVGQFLENVAADDRINGFFANANLPRLNMLLVEQIGQATGGPEVYTGGDMKTVHAGMEITQEDFNALVEDLVAALDQFDVPEAEKNELLGLLGPMQADIVTA